MNPSETVTFTMREIDRLRVIRDVLDGRLRSLGALVEGLSIVRVLKADGHEVVIELSDGTRLFARSDGPLDVSVT